MAWRNFGKEARDALEANHPEGAGLDGWIDDQLSHYDKNTKARLKALPADQKMNECVRILGANMARFA